MKKITKFMIYLIPEIIAAACLIYLKIFTGNTGPAFLSPPDPNPLVLALLIFAVGYLLFLALMFSSDIKEMFVKRATH